jgi:hypothetical protein
MECAEAALSLRQLCALAFVPAGDVVEAYDRLVETDFFANSPDQEEIDELLIYFESTWIGIRGGGNSRRPPQFAVALWNQYDSVLANDPRTNNAVESWHNSFERLLNCAHPSVWSLVDALRKDSADSTARVEQILAGIPQPKRRATYINLDARIKIVVEDYVNRYIVDYLRAISHSITL